MTDQNAIIVQGGGFISPVADIQTALRRYQAVKDFIGSILKPGVDYGVIPGSDKPTLLKPGAETMTAFFGFTVRFVLVDKVLDWTGKDHDGEPFFSFDYRAQLWRGGELVAEGDGSCNSWEKKYRYRNSERVCPACGKPTIIKGKAEYGGGFICFAKKGGCGAKYKDNDPAITEQIVGQVKNPDPADLVNTIQKMAQKRALIAPVLIATNTSEYFTQDIEDYIDGTFVEHVEQPAPTTKAPVATVKASDAPAEPPAPEAPPEVEAPFTPPPGKSAPQSTSFNPVAALVDWGYAQNTFEASAILNKSPYPKARNKNPDELKAWAAKYRGWRDTGLDVDDAATKATAGLSPI